MMKPALQALKDGQSIVIETADSAGVAVLTDSKDEIEMLKKQLEISFDKSCILIGEIGMLYNYVEKIPDIALDIVELAEFPIDMIYAKAKNISPDLLSDQGEVKIRLIQEGPVHQLLFNLRRAVLYIPVKDSELQGVLSVINNTLNLHVSAKECGLKEFKVMKLGFDGEVTFY